MISKIEPAHQCRPKLDWKQYTLVPAQSQSLLPPNINAPFSVSLKKMPQPAKQTHCYKYNQYALSYLQKYPQHRFSLSLLIQSFSLSRAHSTMTLFLPGERHTPRYILPARAHHVSRPMSAREGRTYCRCYLSFWYRSWQRCIGVVARACV